MARCSFVITVFLSLIGIKPMISNKAVVLLIGIALLVVFIGWWTAAEQEEATAKREARLEEMQKTLEAIRTSLPAPPQIAASVEHVSQLSNDKIRKRVADLAARMRTFEGGLQANQMRDVSKRLPPSATEQQRQEAWNAQTAQLLVRSAEAQTQFRSQFLPEAPALREAMLNRLGQFPPYGLIIGRLRWILVWRAHRQYRTRQAT